MPRRPRSTRVVVGLAVLMAGAVGTASGLLIAGRFDDVVANAIALDWALIATAAAGAIGFVAARLWTFVDEGRRTRRDDELRARQRTEFLADEKRADERATTELLLAQRRRVYDAFMRTTWRFTHVVGRARPEDEVDAEIKAMMSDIASVHLFGSREAMDLADDAAIILSKHGRAVAQGEKPPKTELAEVAVRFAVAAYAEIGSAGLDENQT